MSSTGGSDINSKRKKLDVKTSSDPIKTTHASVEGARFNLNYSLHTKEQLSKRIAKVHEEVSETESETESDTSSEDEQSVTGFVTEPKVTAVVAKAFTAAESQHKCRTSSNKPVETILRVLLDSGSNGDLYFHKKGTEKRFPHLKRHMSKSWHTSNGDFSTRGRSHFKLNSSRFKIF